MQAARTGSDQRLMDASGGDQNNRLERATGTHSKIQLPFATVVTLDAPNCDVMRRTTSLKISRSIALIVDRLLLHKGLIVMPDLSCLLASPCCSTQQ